MRYVILQANEDLDEGFDGARRRAWRDPTRASTELTVHTVDGHETDAGELRADPKNAVVMDADIVLSLIAPASTAVSNVATLTPAGVQRMPAGLLAVGAHASKYTGQGVTVAVLDSGCDLGHAAFKVGKQIAKRNFVDDAKRDDVTDEPHGHGTHCAGTVCGAPVGDIRVGVAPGVTKLCIGKVLGPKGGSLEMLLKGMLWAVMEEKADVVSMSLGYDLPGNATRLMTKYGVDPALATQIVLRQQADLQRGISTLRAFLESQSGNVVFVAATGNESKRSAKPSFVLDAGMPAAELFAVGAVGSAASGDRWTVAEFSNGRAQVVAPGVDVVSAAVGGGWTTMSGTSMATPHVAGVAALWVEKLRSDGALDIPDVVRSQLRATAIRSPTVDGDIGAIGAGMVQAPK
jgi:subtilisin family serine protease